jgi:hypothetical protein
MHAGPIWERAKAMQPVVGNAAANECNHQTLSHSQLEMSPIFSNSRPGVALKRLRMTYPFLRSEVVKPQLTCSSPLSEISFDL